MEEHKRPRRQFLRSRHSRQSSGGYGEDLGSLQASELDTEHLADGNSDSLDDLDEPTFSDDDRPTKTVKGSTKTKLHKDQLTRLRNREAQQRFRERQRAEQEQLEMEYEELDEERQELLSEKKFLQSELLVRQKMLLVRDAMIKAYLAANAIPPNTNAQDRSKHEELMLQDLRALAIALEDAAVGDGPSSGGKISPKGEVEGLVLPEEPPTTLLSNPVPSGLSSVLNDKVLEDTPSIPPPSDPEVCSAIQAMKSADELIQYWRGWTENLKAEWQAAEESSFDAEHVARVEKAMEAMIQMWWHAAQIQPQFIVNLTYAALPKDSSQHELWAAIANKLVPELQEKDIQAFRQAWRKYSLRLEQIATGVQHWVQKLAAMSVPGDATTVPASTNAAAMLDFMDTSARIAEAVNEEYKASMEFLANQVPATSMLQKCFINVASYPHMPDLVAITYHILKLAEARAGHKQMTLIPSPAAPALQN